MSIDAGHSTSKGKMPAQSDRPASQIPQLDGPIPYDDDVLSTPNVSSNFFSSLCSYKIVLKHFPFCSLPRLIDICFCTFFTYPFCFLFSFYY